MKRLLFLLLLILSSLSFGQNVTIYGGKAATYSNDVLTIPSGYCAEYQAVYDAWTTKPDAVRSEIYNTRVAQLVAAGYWARIDIFRFYANHTNTAGEALLNWKAPALYAMTLYNAPIHTPDQGIQFGGLIQYGNNNWVPSSNGVNFTQNSASQILYIRTDVASDTWHGTFTNADSKDIAINPRRAGVSNIARIRTNDATAIISAAIVTNAAGLWINTRTAAAVNKLYRNGVAIINGTTASTGLPTHSPYIGAANDDDIAAYFRADQIAIEIWMDGCSQADVTAITAILNGWMTDLGTNVFSPTLLVFLLMFVIYIGNSKKFKNEKDTVNINNAFRMAA